MLASIYDYSHETLLGERIPFTTYKGKVLLIVNTASKCSFTPQYNSLESLYKEYSRSGLEILGFPSDDFLHQEPGSDEEIARFCEVSFGVTFPMFKKSHVKGSEINPLYEWLNAQDKTKGAVRWNFEKILVSRDGEACYRIRSRFSPSSKEMIEKLQELLGI